MEKTRFPPHLWDKWEGKQLIVGGNFDVLMRGLVILVLAVAIYDAGGFYVISIYCRRSGLWHSALTNVAIVMKKRGGLFVVGIEHRHIPLESATKRTSIQTTLAHTGGASSYLYFTLEAQPARIAL